MIKLTDLKAGDLVNIIDEGGVERHGVVSSISRDEGMVCVDNGIQEFWYTLDKVVPLPVSEERLVHLLGFEKEMLENGGVKFKKGPFRILLRAPGNYSDMEIWYREDHRHFHQPLYVHELQNHHLDMTKVQLEPAVTH